MTPFTQTIKNIPLSQSHSYQHGQTSRNTNKHIQIQSTRFNSTQPKNPHAHQGQQQQSKANRNKSPKIIRKKIPTTTLARATETKQTKITAAPKQN